MQSKRDGWGAPVWLRGVFAAARGHCTGRFSLETKTGGHFQILFRQGRPIRVLTSAEQSPKVGALIVATRKTSEAAQLRAARTLLGSGDTSDDDQLIGGWMVERGLCSRAELCAALRVQMSIRFEDMFRDRSGQGMFYSDAVEAAPGLEPETFASLCMRTARRMRARANGWEGEFLKVSFVGRQLLRSFALGPAERACLELCARQPIRREQLHDILGDATIVREAFSALFWLGAFERARRGHGSYLSLLQERRWSRLQVRAAGLAPEERRRRISAAHPDRFADDPSLAVKHASESALRALLQQSS